MADPHSRIFFPSGFQELFAVWNRFPRAVLYAGGAEQARKQSRRVIALPAEIISLDKLAELRNISRTERYLEIGAMVRLNQIVHLSKIVPEALTRCLGCVAGPLVRNIATIGGTICNPSRRFNAAAPLIALEAQYELRSPQSSRWIPASRFSSLIGPPPLARHELLTRVRVPLEPWTFTRYQKFNCPGNSETGGGVIFLVRIEKNILTNIRVVYSGISILREKNSETMLVGKHLPLDRKDAAAFVDKWKSYLSVFSGNEQFIFPGEKNDIGADLTKERILGFIENTILNITD